MLELNDALRNVSVLGAAGKMGSGISLLLLQLMASNKAQTGRGFQLNLVDVKEEMLGSLKNYLRDQLTKYAERTINSLRKWYASRSEIIDNEQAVNFFVEEALDDIHYSTFLESAKSSQLIFEAIIEDVDVKAETFASLNKICGKGTYYFSNTSSIPISVLAEKSGVGNRIIGYHFYNPPAVQKLLEIIVPENADDNLVSLAVNLAKSLEKTAVFSKDIAGFIGNGYFIREIAFTLEKVKELSSSIPLVEAIYIINQITQEYLVRPMGTFQLLDYVGIDVCQRIVNIMKTYISDLTFDENLIHRMIKNKVLGGQYPDGSQKEGFFRYKNRIPVEIYDLEEKKYILIENVAKKCEKRLENLSKKPISWKTLSKVSKSQRKQGLEEYFQDLLQDNSTSALLAKELLQEAQNIAEGLVNDGVARKMEDVNTVLENGFFHLYGPSSLPLSKESRSHS